MKRAGGMNVAGNEKTLKVAPVGGLHGVVCAPASKSYTHRALIVSSLGDRARVINPLWCDDTRHTVAMCRRLGAEIRRVKGGRELLVRGCKRHPALSGKSVNVGESGTLLRFVLPLLSLTGRPVRVTGTGSLVTRPNAPVVDVLRSWGVDIHGRGRAHRLPIEIRPCGRLAGGLARVEGKVTSQVVSALLIAAPLADEDTTLLLDSRLVSRPYVDITIDVLAWAGVKVERDGYKKFRVRSGQKPGVRGDFTVHGDYSSAAFLLAAAAATRSTVTVTDLVNDSQGDRRILSLLKAMGANVRRRGDKVTVTGGAHLRGVDVDASDIPDLVPVLTAMGCLAKGTTRIRNVAHLVHKESNRLSRPAGELGKLGAKIKLGKDEVVIKHARLAGGKVSACGDHRIAMALAVAAIGQGLNLEITGAECIGKSYPGFVKDMKQLHADVTLR
jgi:3-phosphoshikimate 1-carboxyvinyltransferase